ncbi:MAG: hypothetical protein IPM18_02760 [Phycisphaerales bacterium]|nr:hypothetical protein [Phycisphaerales bacterium]
MMQQCVQRKKITKPRAAMDLNLVIAEATRIAQIRRQIAEGTYLTSDKLEAALERLLESVRQVPRPARRATGS